MPVDTKTVIENMPFHVLIEQSDDGLYVAQCIQTGAIAEGRTIEEAETLIKAILENDFQRAVEAGSIASLICAPAPFDVVVRWHEMKGQDPKGFREIPLAVSAGPQRRDVQSEVRISTGVRQASVA